MTNPEQPQKNFRQKYEELNDELAVELESTDLALITVLRNHTKQLANLGDEMAADLGLNVPSVTVTEEDLEEISTNLEG